MNFGLNATYAWALLAVIVSAIISLFISAQLGFFVLLFATLAWWVWENPEEGFLFFLITAPLLPMFKATQTIDTLTLAKDVIILALFARVFAWPLLTRQLSYRRNILFAPMVALAAWTAVALLRADSPLVGILRARDIALYALLYLAILYLPHNPRVMRQRFKWFAVSLAVALSHALYQLWFAQDSAILRFDPMSNMWIPRLASTLGHPSVFGHYLILAGSLLAATALTVKSIRARLLTAAWLALLPFVYLTYSRAAWLGWGIMTMILVGTRFIASSQGFNKLNPYKISFSFLIIFLLFTTLLIAPAGKFLRSTLTVDYASNQERLEFLVRLIAPITNTDALFGRGLGDVTAQNFRQINLGTIDVVSGQARSVQLAKSRTLVDNQYLKTFVEMGLIGTLIYLWLYWRVLQSSWRTRSSPIGLAGLAFFSAFIIQAFFIDIWDIFPTNAYFWILAALVSADQNPRCHFRTMSTAHSFQ